MSADCDRALPLLSYGVDIAVDALKDMRHVAGGADGGDGSDSVETDIIRRRQNRCTAQTVSHKQDRLCEALEQMLCRSNQICDIRGETGMPEIPLAASKPGKVEPQAGDALLRQGTGNMYRRPALPGAGKAMREQRGTTHQTRR